jgi:hypothetical protein
MGHRLWEKVRYQHKVSAPSAFPAITHQSSKKFAEPRSNTLKYPWPRWADLQVLTFRYYLAFPDFLIISEGSAAPYDVSQQMDPVLRPEGLWLAPCATCSMGQV